ncbi:hypothetical protein GGD83_004286 [Rhodoblastus sphagnicola]|uniref:DUF3313 domain-containing protein n=1 Tax=Rhodoblastus sphagnicola TaxID=333368 RepID=UPI0017B7A5DE|nr:DUF3313 domain-containing protein [Rhodoblastus sphagnicola]MBB4200457.1 hypothetical protein [Rhodoblastus sphagnicola]
MLGALSALSVCALLTACAEVEPIAYAGLPSSRLMKPNSEDPGGSTPFIYSSETKWAAYSKAIVDPVSLYQGPDHQFGDMAESDRAELARYMQEKFSATLAKRFTIISKPGPDTLRITLSLTGAAATPLLGELAHADMAGNVYNGVAAARDKEGLMSGWVMYVVEIHDSTKGRLLLAYTTKQYPNALHLGAAFGSLAAARIGIDNGADELVARLL